MFPVLLKTPFFTLYSYGVFLAAAYLSAIELAFYKAGKIKLDPVAFSNFILIAVLSAFGGSRALFVWLEWEGFRDAPWRALFIWEGGFVFYGGLLGCLLVTIPFVYRNGLGVVRVADLCMPSVALGHAIGRIGCLGVGCCYGGPTELPWGIHLPNLVHRFGPEHRVHPTQLYASASLFVLLFLLERAWKTHRRRYPGWVFILYCYYQAVHRYTLETLRVDDRGGTFLLGMTVSQEVAVGLGLLAITLHAAARRWYWPRFAGGETGDPA